MYMFPTITAGIFTGIPGAGAAVVSVLLPLLPGDLPVTPNLADLPVTPNPVPTDLTDLPVLPDLCPAKITTLFPLLPANL